MFASFCSEDFVLWMLPELIIQIGSLVIDIVRESIHLSPAWRSVLLDQTLQGLRICLLCRSPSPTNLICLGWDSLDYPMPLALRIFYVYSDVFVEWTWIHENIPYYTWLHRLSQFWGIVFGNTKIFHDALHLNMRYTHVLCLIHNNIPRITPWIHHEYAYDIWYQKQW